MKKLSTRRIALIGGAILAGAAIAAPHSHADPETDATFLEMLARNGFDASTGSQGLITAGHSVCAALYPYTGASSDTLANAGVGEAETIRRSNPALSMDSAEQFVAIAVVVLCPWDAPHPANSATGSTAAGSRIPTGGGNFNPKVNIDTSTTRIG